ncbi:MAG: RNA pseudouridine synthase [Planctomycetaceae bacterium]|nr:RNA pseudouridine synthase [Planctomycetaceae bacterium]
MTDTTGSSQNSLHLSNWEWPDDPQETLRPSVLYFDHECLVVNKPAGLLTQAPAGVPSVEAQTRRFFRACASRGSDPHQTNDTGERDDAVDYVGVPHRLDRATSGALLMGQSKAVTRKLAAQFEKRTIKKIYWALIEGCLQEACGSWTDWMRKLPDRALSEITTPDDPNAQWAELDFKTLAVDARCSLIEICLKTGRTHQIRLQASHRGLPILGDAEYGSRIDFGEAFADHRRRAIALHARMIDFWHPKRHHPVVVTAPVPTAWREFAAAHATKLRPLLDSTSVV